MIKDSIYPEIKTRISKCIRQDGQFITLENIGGQFVLDELVEMKCVVLQDKK